MEWILVQTIAVGHDQPQVLGRYETEDAAVNAWADLNREAGIDIDEGDERQFYVESDDLWVVPLPQKEES